MKPEKPELSIIIINWHSKNFLHDCLESIYRYTEQTRIEIIVIDNASYDGAKEMLATLFPAVNYLQSEQNLGFSKANNLAAKSAKADTLLFLNPDILLEEPAIDKLYGAFKSQNFEGAMGCILLNADRTIQTSAIQKFPTILSQLLDIDFLQKRFPGFQLWDKSPLYRTEPALEMVDMISGACIMISIQLFEKINGFSEDYFMYAEDLDLCFKIKKLGKVIKINKNSRVVHFGGGSSNVSDNSMISSVMQKQSIYTYFLKFHSKLYSRLFQLTQGINGLAHILTAVIFFPITLSLRGSKYSFYTIKRWHLVVLWGFNLSCQRHPISTTRLYTKHQSKLSFKNEH